VEEEKKSFFFVGGVLLGTAIGATLDLNGHDKATCVVAVVAAQLAYVLTGLLVQDRLKHRRSLRPEAGR
jgi:hypothetical protein